MATVHCHWKTSCWNSSQWFSFSVSTSEVNSTVSVKFKTTSILYLENTFIHKYDLFTKYLLNGMKYTNVSAQEKHFQIKIKHQDHTTNTIPFQRRTTIKLFLPTQHKHTAEKISERFLCSLFHYCIEQSQTVCMTVQLTDKLPFEICT